ncbi:MAG: dicarboxylate/amino acid:cation symporter [Prevotella pectinovora]|jgi:Na+/H+-dicarboxylate symporter|uniref:Sodium:proton antiporter n=5 Tax=Prevotella TaxID=838 RepID=A0A0D0J2W2_9BACT|nr:MULTISPECIES: dicarboxylate/amino acid:cation symporter [Prevotella]KIP59879.1 sodium:proton antiporter [Prevotella pectinovora]KIP64918.1 sodium:proton antiporter [Prevotella pectinovora]MCI6047777.1 dicarboxylate/amino acid:cation symporter [Prevotella pectinovora]MDD7744204.1 dicarboxylate/amino acid:cation symporter [Prevotella pectinovora]MDY4777926.1 dicarboxylate/amino acid:cation symporter [Prevotella pectinovora]
MKTFKIGLLPKIIIAIVCGVVFGMFLPGEVVRVFLTFNGIFSQFLGFLIPLLILGLVAPAISDIGQGAGKMLIATTALAYFATVTSGLLSYAVSELTFPSLIDTQTTAASLATTEAMAPFFTVEIPAPMNVMTALVLAFTLGLTTATMQSVALKNVMKDFMQVIIKTINVAIIPLLPIYIFGIFLNMAYTGDAARVLTVFVKIIGVIFVMHIFLLIFQYCVAGAFVGKNPFRLLGRMLPAYFTALGTQSSAATIPVTLRQTIANGVNKSIAGFVIPLCATIHMSGSVMKIVACAMALMMMQHISYDFVTVIGFILMLAISIVAAPGVPGGAIMASLGVLASILGFTEADQALMIALYIAMDSFGTACNVTGDGSLALLIDKWFGGKDKSEK